MAMTGCGDLLPCSNTPDASPPQPIRPDDLCKQIRSDVLRSTHHGTIHHHDCTEVPRSPRQHGWTLWLDCSARAELCPSTLLFYVVQALALGADAVMVGRPVLWGLTIDGQEGVRRVITCPCQRPHRQCRSPHSCECSCTVCCPYKRSLSCTTSYKASSAIAFDHVRCR